MKSPEYTGPVMDFIDENCMVFGGEEVRIEGECACRRCSAFCCNAATSWV